MIKETPAFKLKVHLLLDEIRRTGKVYLPTTRAKRKANQKYHQEMMKVNHVKTK